MSSEEQNRAIRYDEEDGRILIDGPEDIPDFATDEEELEFWHTHTPSEKFWAGAKHLSPWEILGLPEPQRTKKSARSRRQPQTR